MPYARPSELDRTPDGADDGPLQGRAATVFRGPASTPAGGLAGSVRERGVDAAIFAYAVFVLIACSSAFKLFGLTTPAFALVYLGGSALVVLQARQLLARPGLLFLALLFPLFALCSTLWGIDPTTTLRHAVQLTFTALIGACIGCALRPRPLMLAMTSAFVGLILLSVANLWLQIVPPFQQRDYLEGNEYFTGIFAHKNTLGLVLCLGALCLAYLASDRRPGWPFAVALVLLLPVFLYARSSTSIALYACILCMPFLHAFLRLRAWRGLILLVVLCAVLTLAMLLEVLSVSLIDIGLELVGKGRDMSGRTVLWTIAVDQISSAPWLGVGYQSFWTSPLFAGEVDLVHGLLEPSIGHFHNVWLETLVGTGILGLIALLALPVALSVRFALRLWRPDCSAMDVAGLFLVMLALVRANVETNLYFQHQTENIIMVALLFSTAASRVRGEIR